MSVFGTACYEVNSQLIWRWFITDNSFGYRIILFGSFLGLFLSIILGDKSKTFNNERYFSNYKQISLGMLGFLFVWVCYPFLSTLSLSSGSATDSEIMFATLLNMFLAMIASILGTFTACALVYKKFTAYDMIFTGTAVHFY